MTKVNASKQVETAKKDIKKVFANAKDYSRNLYLAGLGVYNTTEQQRSKAYKEVVKTGTSIFKDLVKAGEGLEKKGRGDRVVGDSPDFGSTARGV